MLVYHRDRMREAAQHFDFDAVEERLRDGKALHDELLREVKRWTDQGNQDGPMKVGSSSIHDSHVPSLKHPPAQSAI